MRPSEAGEVCIVDLVFPDHANHLGTLFGGQALAWMDKAAFIAASRHARRSVVTARSERVDFRAPVRTGQLVEVRARVVSQGRSSMQVDVSLFAEDLLDGARTLCCSGRFVMIALDGHGRPAAPAA